MMETKLSTALCALLLFNLASAVHEEDRKTNPPASPSALLPAEASAPSSDPDAASDAQKGPDASLTSNSTLSLSLNTVTENKTMPSQEPADVIPETGLSGKDGNSTDQESQPPEVLPESHSPTSPASPPPTNASITQVAPTLPAFITPTTTPFTNGSNTSSTHASIAAASVSPSQPTTTASTSAPAPEPQKPQTSPTPTSTRPSSTSSSSSSQSTPGSNPPIHTSTSSRQLGSSTEARLKSATMGTSAQAKTHADSPSQLNVGGDTSHARDSPPLDPLLAGLVSAFIITAVIITLLLFLKLRRRDTRPEFRRLQDLPMDDMMEDTPLSMYSY